ncbi:MAG: HD domain-containing protein [Lachnospiraceae bacterium]|nr:HD domain-containing protein [Lachnospiraceae bacterium]
MEIKPFRCKTEDLTPGMVTVGIVRSPSGQEILMPGTRLTKFLITRLVYYKVESADVLIPPTETIAIPPSAVFTEQEEEPKPPVEPVAPKEPEPPAGLSDEELTISPYEDEEKPTPAPAPKPVEEAKSRITVAPMPQTAVFKNTEVKPKETRILKATDKIVAPTGIGGTVNPTYSQAVKRSEKFKTYETEFAIVLAQMSESFPKIARGEMSIHPEEAIEGVKHLFKMIPTSIERFDMIHNMRENDDAVYAHSLNVAMIARQIAVWLKLPDEEVDVVTLAGIYHDIGKLKVPIEILNKTEKLTDDEFKLLRNHPMYGMEILKRQDIDVRVKKAAVQHHERSDGSGYPRGLMDWEIEDESYLIALADVYEAMTAKRAFRAPLSPFQVIAEFEKNGFSLYKTEYLLTFMKQIAKTYQNNRIMLNNGASANIVLLNENRLSKPVVQLNDGTCIDLSNSNLYIQALI